MTSDEVKVYINHALAASRGLTSDLASDIIKKMKNEIHTSVIEAVNEVVPPVVKVVVNGKIDGIKEDVKNLKEHLERQDFDSQKRGEKYKDMDIKIDSILQEQKQVKNALGVAETVTNPIIKIKNFWGTLFGGFGSIGTFIKWLASVVVAVGSLMAVWRLLTKYIV